MPEWAETALLPGLSVHSPLGALRKTKSPPDLGFHAVPGLALVLDLLLFSPPWTITAMPSFGLSTTIAFAYWFWVEQCYSYNGWYVCLKLSPRRQLVTSGACSYRYPYPLFEKLSTPWRLALFLVSASLMVLNTSLLKYVYGKLNGKLEPDMIGKALGETEKRRC